MAGAMLVVDAMVHLKRLTQGFEALLRALGD